MIASLETLLNGIIDYAGLFPPACLPMEAAVGKYVESRQPGRPSNWIVDKFVCNAERLGELAPFMSGRFNDAGPIELSVLGRKIETVADVASAVEADVFLTRSFLSEFRTAAIVRNLEFALPEAAFANADVFAASFKAFAARVGAEFWNSEAIPIHAFIEFPHAVDEVWRERIKFYVDGLGEATLTFGDKVIFAPKLRTGGTVAKAIPSSEFLAGVMTVFHDIGTPWKATAGLHHPFRRHDPELGCKMHGFLNVAIADAIGKSKYVEVAEIVDILEEQNEVRFQFEANLIRWRERQVHINDIADARFGSFLSFGSCSYDEPIDDLNKYGLL